MAGRPLPVRARPAPAVSATSQLTLAGPAERPGPDQERNAPAGGERAPATIGVVVAAARRSRCLVLVPEDLTPGDAEAVRNCRQGAVAWSGRVPHFTADVGQNRCLHVLGDDPERSVYAPGSGHRASLVEDFWPATFDLYQDGGGASTQVRGPAVPPRASRPVWAALDVGVEVQPQDVVVVILSEAAQPTFLDSRPPEPPHVGRWARSALRGAAGAVAGAAIVLLGVLTAVAVSPSLLGDSKRGTPEAAAPGAPLGTGAGARVGPTLTGFGAYAARVRGANIKVYDRPGRGTAPVRSFPAVGDYGARQTFLVEREQREPDGVWYEVLLPVRPNGTTGWVRAGDVEVTGLPYRIEVHLGSLQLHLFHDGRLERTFPIGIGTLDTPTPPGRYAIKYLMRPDDQDTLYGHFVYGLSGFSDAVRDAPGRGELGIHGTNDPEHSIGRRVSQGCIRLHNADIESLVPVLPLGTPVDVVDDRARR